MTKRKSEDIIISMLQQIDSKMGGLDTKITGLSTRICNLEEKVHTLEERSNKRQRVDTEMINECLANAVKNRQVDRIKSLLPLSEPRDIRLETSYLEGEPEYTPILMYAISNNALEVVEVLIKDPRIDLNQKVALAYDSETPLLQAITNGSQKIVELLLWHGADPDLPNNGGVTPLHRAAYRGYCRILHTLMRGVPIGTTGREHAWERRRKESILDAMYRSRASNNLLKEHWRLITDYLVGPVDIFKKDKKGTRAIQFARKQGHVNAANMLKRAMDHQRGIHSTTEYSKAGKIG